MKRRDVIALLGATGISLPVAAAAQQAAGAPRDQSVASTSVVRVNDFGAIGDGHSHPLLQKYSTLEAAQAVYPHATALTDEIDWCAWQKAANAVYHNPRAMRTAANLSGGVIEADGQYVVNRTITFNSANIRILGTNIGVAADFDLATSITYRGPAGTLDDPIYIFDFYTIDELGKSPPGLRPSPGAKSGGRWSVERMTFIGQRGNMRANRVDVSKFVSGVRVRMGSLVRLTDCSFAGTLWDGIACTGPQTFFIVERCRFDAVHRDAIAVRGIWKNFSTTCRIRDNEFYFVGRYALLVDCWGSIESMNIVTNNDFEHSYKESFFVKNPSWFVSGAVTGMCMIGCGNLIWRDNRTEGIILTQGYLGELHLVSCTRPSIEDGTLHMIVMTATKHSKPRTQRLIDFADARHYFDITDQRNYHCGSLADWDGVGNIDVSLANLYNLTRLILGGGVGLSGTTSARMIEIDILSYPVTPGIDGLADTITPSAAPTAMGAGLFNFVADGCWLPDQSSLNNASTAANPFQKQRFWGTWRRTLAARSGSDNIEELVLFGEMFWRFGNNDGGVGDSWAGYKGLTLNRLLADLTVADSAYMDLPLFYANIKDQNEAAVRYVELAGAVATTRRIRYNFLAPPTSRKWNKGDIVYNKSPVPGGWIGWVCVEGGTPGTWKGFGAIES